MSFRRSHSSSTAIWHGSKTITELTKSQLLVSARAESVHGFQKLREPESSELRSCVSNVSVRHADDKEK